MPTPAEVAEDLEARIRRAMFEHASIKPRGFDSQRDRNAIHRDIDTMFDQFACMTLLASLSHHEASL